MSEQYKPETWYRVRWREGLPEISEARVVASSTLYVTFESGVDRLRVDGNFGTFPTWEEAQAFAMARVSERLAAAVHSVVVARNALDRLEKMTDPTATAPEVEKETAQHE